MKIRLATVSAICFGTSAFVLSLSTKLPDTETTTSFLFSIGGAIFVTLGVVFALGTIDEIVKSHKK